MSSSSSSTTRTLAIIYFNVFLYATCFQLQRPLEPFLVEKLLSSQESGRDAAQEYARLQSFFSLLQTGGSLVSGVLLDKLGVRGAFLLSFGASALCYALLAQAESLPLLYASKVPSVLQAGFLCAQCAVARLTAHGAPRVAALGRLATSYTVGAVLGPALGGVLRDARLAAQVAVVGSVLSMALTLLLPRCDESEDEKESERESDSASSKSDEPSETLSFWRRVPLVWRAARLLLVAKVVASLANATAQSALPLVLKTDFSLSESALGLSLSASSACNALFNGFLLGPVVHSLGGDLTRAISLSLSLIAALFVLQALCALPQISPLLTSLSHNLSLFSDTQLGLQLSLFLGTTLAMAPLQHLLATSLTSQSTARVPAGLRGTLLGMEHSLFALARVFTPSVGVFLWQRGGVAAVAAACAATFALMWLCWRSGAKKSDSSAAEKESSSAEVKEKTQ